MKEKIKKIIFIIFIFLAITMPIFSFAQENNSLTVQMLSQRVDMIENINQKLLNTVYWTLGVLAAIFIALVSVNLYFNISANKRELKETKEKLLSTAENEIIASESRILEKIAKSNAQEFERIKTELLTTTKNEIISAKSSIIEKIARLETNAEQMKYNIDGLEMDLKELETIRYAEEGKQGAITIPIRLLNKAIERNQEFKITEYLFQIRDYIKENPIRSYVNIDLEKELVKLEKKTEFKTTIEEIRKLKKVVKD